MSLSLATILAAVLVFIPAIWFLWNGESVERLTKQSLRDPWVTKILMTLGTVWFLWVVLHLGEAEFGKYKNLLFIFFLIVGVGSWYCVRDFLAVRAVSILTLLLCNEFLKAAFSLYEIPSRLVLVTGSYLAIVLALYLGASPFRARDFFNWLFQNKIRVRSLGILLGSWSLALVIALTTY